MTKLTTRPPRTEESPFRARRKLSLNFPADALPPARLRPRPIDAAKRAFALRVVFPSRALSPGMHLQRGRVQRYGSHVRRD